MKKFARVVSFFDPLWRKMLVIAALTTITFLYLSKTPLNLTKESEAATNYRPIVTDMSATLTYGGQYIAIHAETTDYNNDPVVAAFRIREGSNCATARTVSWVPKQVGEHVTYFTYKPGVLYYYSVKARDSKGAYSEGPSFCGTDGWKPAKTIRPGA